MFRTAETLKEGRAAMDDIVESYKDIGVHPVAVPLIFECWDWGREGEANEPQGF